MGELIYPQVEFELKDDKVIFFSLGRSFEVRPKKRYVRFHIGGIGNPKCYESNDQKRWSRIKEITIA